jgi:hypothetical protein
VSGTYYSTSSDGYQLSIAHLVDKGNTSRYKDTYRRVLPCNLSHHHPKTLHMVHNIAHAYKVKQDSILHFIGTICTGDCLAQRKKLESMGLDEVVPHAPLQ